MQISPQLPLSSSQGIESTQRISSGQRINSAADDAAGLSQVSRIDSSIKGSQVAFRNIGDAMSLMQTTDGQMQSMQDTLSRMTELTQQAGNGSYGPQERQALAAEFQQLAESFNEQSQRQFNGKSLFAGEGLNVQTGANREQQVDLALPTINTDDLNDLSSNPFGDRQRTESVLSGLSEQLSSGRSLVGAQSNSLESQANRLQQSDIDAQQSRSRIQDTDIAEESARLARENIKEEVSIALQAQSNANSSKVLQLIS